MKKHLLLGTAGHVDHGKTTLIHALTGVDTDRLPDEKRRQITIDLGFAPLEIDGYTIGVVDVPGHERYVKNMLAGAAGVDFAMLVVAADDSVKLQTREHLEILQHLRFPAGLIVITKCDLAEPEWIDLVESEIRELVVGTFLSGSPVIRVSARTGAGLDLLRSEIVKVAGQALNSRQSHSTEPFRLGIDRVFSLPGHGAIVTGSAASGTVRVGDSLEIQPAGYKVRVKGLQCHNRAIELAGCGQRVAVNLAGIHYSDIARGQSLVTAKAVPSSRLLTVELQLSEEFPRRLKNRSSVRLHIGTASVPGSVALLGTPSRVQPHAEAGDTLFAQLHLSQPVATVWGQPFVLRSVSPVETIGGGRVLQPAARKIKPSDETLRKTLEELADGNEESRAAAVAFAAGLRGLRISDLTTLAGVADTAAVLEQLLEKGIIVSMLLSIEKTVYLHTNVAAYLERHVTEKLAAEHDETPLRTWVEQSRLLHHLLGISSELLEACCNSMHSRNLLVIDKHGIALPGWSPHLSPEQEALLQECLAAYRAAALQPPSLGQLATELGVTRETLAEIVEVAVEAGDLVRINKELLLDCHAEQQLRKLVTARMFEVEQLSVSQIRDLLGTSRKTVVPFCEYLDAIGLTKRIGDDRRLAQQACHPQADSSTLPTNVLDSTGLA